MRRSGLLRKQRRIGLLSYDPNFQLLAHSGEDVVEAISLYRFEGKYWAEFIESDERGSLELWDESGARELYDELPHKLLPFAGVHPAPLLPYPIAPKVFKHDSEIFDGSIETMFN